VSSGSTLRGSSRNGARTSSASTGSLASGPSSARRTHARSARRDGCCRARSCCCPVSARRARPRRTARAHSRAALPLRSSLLLAPSSTASARAARTGAPAPRARPPGSRARSGPPPAGSYSFAVKRPLVVAAAALALATPSFAALPRVHARAYLVEDGQTGQVLAQSRPHARVPIASITKLMTVLLTLQHTKPNDVVTVARGAAAVGESSIELRA